MLVAFIKEENLSDNVSKVTQKHCDVTHTHTKIFGRHFLTPPVTNIKLRWSTAAARGAPRHDQRSFM